METATVYGIDDPDADLRRITGETHDHKEIIRRVGPLAKRFAANTDGRLSDDYYGWSSASRGTRPTSTGVGSTTARSREMPGSRNSTK